MSNIVEVLERQRLGFSKNKNIEVGFKYLYGLNDDRAEELNSCPLFTARFSPLAEMKDIIAIAAEDGNIIVRNTYFPLSSSKSRGAYHLLRAHNNAVFDLTWAENSPRLVTASADFTAALWDVSGPCVHRIMYFIGHKRSVRTVAASPTDSNVFATGSRDGSVLMWDCRGPRDVGSITPENTLRHCHVQTSGNISKTYGVDSITSVVFVDSHTIATCSAGQGSINLWDMRRTYQGSKRRPCPKFTIHHPLRHDLKGYSCLSVSPCRLRLYASCIDSTLYCFDIGTFSPKPIYQYRGHSVSSFYIKHSVSPCGRYIVSGSGDNKAYLWKEGDSSPAATLSGHSSEVTSAFWASHNLCKVATASEDGSYAIWSLNPSAIYAEPQTSYSCTPASSAKQIVKSVHTCRFNCKKAQWKAPIRESPMKSPIKQLAKRPRFENLLSSPDFNPTINLPNFVIDGGSPSVSSHSGKKRTRQEDWLTKLRRETPPGSKISSKKTPSPRYSKAKGSLLKFFGNQPKRVKSNGSMLNVSQRFDSSPNTSLCCNNTVQTP